MTAQRKLHHIVNHPPSTTSSSYEEVVIGWILNNLHESIALTVVFLPITKHMWESLKEMYGNDKKHL